MTKLFFGLIALMLLSALLNTLFPHNKIVSCITDTVAFGSCAGAFIAFFLALASIPISCFLGV